MTSDFFVKTVLPIVGSFLAIVGLVFAIIRFRYAKSKDKILSEPEIEIFRELDEAGFTEIFLSNEGDGRANIQKLELVLGDKIYVPLNPDTIKNQTGLLGINASFSYWWIPEPEKVIKKGFKESLFKIDPNTPKENQEQINEALKELKFRVEYLTPFNKRKVKIR